MQKKLLFSFYLFFAGVSIASAQVSLGVKAGGALAEVTDLSLLFPTTGGYIQESYAPQVFPLGGVWAEYRLSPNFQLRQEVLYSQRGKGAASSSIFSGFSVASADQSRYEVLALPLLFQIKPKRMGFGVGLEPAYLLAVSYRNRIISGYDRFTRRPEAIGNQRWMLGLLMALSFDFDELAIELRSNLGLTPMQQEIQYTDSSGASFDYGFKHRNLELTVAYRLLDRQKL